MKHTIYSLRHTAICMRIILSEGQVNIFNLAKNAGTSVDQIERFYARNLPLSQGNGDQLAEFWERVDVTAPYGKTRKNALCHHPRKEWSPTRG